MLESDPRLRGGRLRAPHGDGALGQSQWSGSARRVSPVHCPKSDKLIAFHGRIVIHSRYCDEYVELSLD